MFDVPPPFLSRGIDAYMATWQTFFTSSAKPVAFDFEDVDITAGADVAFATAKVFRSLMPETAALLLEWVKDKQPEDYLFPAGRPSAVPHIGRIVFRAYCRQAGIPAHFSHPHCLKHALGTHVIHQIGIHSTLG